jgi:hypothetical protein
MTRFLIVFQVEQLLIGTIEVEAESRDAAAARFYCGDYDEARLAAKLELEDSEDAVVEVSAAVQSCELAGPADNLTRSGG